MRLRNDKMKPSTIIIPCYPNNTKDNFHWNLPLASSDFILEWIVRPYMLPVFVYRKPCQLWSVMRTKKNGWASNHHHNMFEQKS